MFLVFQSIVAETGFILTAAIFDVSSSVSVCVMSQGNIQHKKKFSSIKF